MISQKLVPSIVVIILLVSLLIACGATEEPKEPTETVEEPTESVEEPTESVEEHSGPVAILVIDDFDLGNGQPSGDQSSDSHCTFTPLGQKHAAFREDKITVVGVGMTQHAGSSGMIEAAWGPHGPLVYHKFLDLFSVHTPAVVAAAGATTTTGESEFGLNWMGTIQAWEIGPEENAKIFLVQVDTGGYDTEIVATRIGEAINKLEDEWGIKRFVLNMSFGILPCNLEIDYEKYADDVKRQNALSAMDREPEDVANLSEDGESKYIDEYIIGWQRKDLAYARLDMGFAYLMRQGDDPLYDFLADPNQYAKEKLGIEIGNDTHIISVASAGNHDKEFPFAPALWENVISVSAPSEQFAKVVDGKCRWFRSNNGEVMTSGMGEVMVDDTPVLIRATSFAAPELSYYAAHYLLQQEPQQDPLTCAGNVDTTTPPLAYAPPPPTYTAGSAPWLNLPLCNAAEDYCANFPCPLSASIVPYAGSLTIWAVDQNTVAALESLGEKFRALYGVEVIVETLNSDEILDTLQVVASSGEGPDIIVGPHEWLGELVPNKLLAEIDLGNNEGNFLPGAVQAFHSGDAQYGLPYAVSNLALFYNPELVTDVPETWFELMDLAAELQENGTVPYGYVLQSDHPYFFVPVQTAFGGYVFGLNDDASYNLSEVGIDDPGSLEAARWLNDMVANGLLLLADSNAAYELFEAGKAAMIVTGPWALDRFRETGASYAIANLPAETQASQPFLSVQGLMATTLSENPCLPKLFLTEFMATGASMQLLHEEIGSIPSAHLAVQAGIDDPDLRALGMAGENGLPVPAIPQMPAVWELWTNAISLILQQEQEPELAFSEAAIEIRKVMEIDQK